MTDQPFIGPVLNRTVNTHCFNWEPYTLQQIWQMLEQETGQTSWAQVTAWGRMKNLCEDQARQLRQALDELAALWPPERSEASRLYRDVVLTMARSLDDSANAAHMNAKALSHLTVGISETRQKIAHLVEQLNARETEQAERERNRLPFWPDSGLIDTQRSELNRAARQIMSDADVIPATATADFRAPGRYSVPSYAEDRTTVDPGAEASASGTSGIAGFAIPTMRVPAPIIDPPAPATAFELAVGANPQVGSPELAGTPTADTPPSPSPADPWTLTPAVGAPGAAASPPSIFASPRIPGGVGSEGIIGTPRVPSPGTSPTSTRAATSSSTRAAVPASGHPGMLAPMAQPAMRAAPGSGHAGQGGRRRRPPDPSDPWFVAHGHPPVIEPRDEPISHDPGPGVIGIDR